MPVDDWRLRGAPNFRDFGGYVAADGRRVRRGILFRSGKLAALTQSDLARVADLNVRSVFDLRGIDECACHPTRWPNVSTPEFLHLDITADVRSDDGGVFDQLRIDLSSAGGERVMMRLYGDITRRLRRHLFTVFSRLASDDGTPVVIHCTAGKDRTGVLVALILLSLGVAREDVYEDYRLTEVYADVLQLKAEIATLVRRTVDIQPQSGLVDALATVRDAYLDAALLAIDEEHGSLRGYLASVGIDEALLKRLHDRLLEA